MATEQVSAAASDPPASPRPDPRTDDSTGPAEPPRPTLRAAGRWPRPVLPATPVAVEVRQVLKCRNCGRTQPRPAAEAGVPARGKWPECCGKFMLPADQAEGEDVPVAEPAPERRGIVRRPARSGVRTELRRGPMGMGQDLAFRLVDISEAGARIKLKAPVCPGEPIEVAMWPPGGLRPIRGAAVVCWCRPATDGTAQAGVRFRRRLGAGELRQLAEV